jgi:hypothetical protein
MPEKHSRMVGQGRAVWLTERLWVLARVLPVRRVPIAQIREFDLNCWFGPEDAPTCRAVAAHALRIARADLRYPIILSSDGGLMDGGHRVCKAWMLGLTEIAAVQFAQDPEPDYVIPGAA